MDRAFPQVLIPKSNRVEVKQFRYLKHRLQVFGVFTFQRLLLSCHNQVSSDFVI